MAIPRSASRIVAGPAGKFRCIMTARFRLRPTAGLPDCSDWAYSTALMTKPQPLTRHIVSINDLTNKEIETIFQVAQGFLKELADRNVPYRIGRGTSIASKFILASLFYEPSTRTRLSFESAMLRLGGDKITSADPAAAPRPKAKASPTPSGSPATTPTSLSSATRATALRGLPPNIRRCRSSMAATAVTSTRRKRCAICSRCDRRTKA